MSGLRIYAKNPGKRIVKLDHHMSNRTFVGYTVTTKNIYFIDDSSNNVKLGTHALFDETHFMVDNHEAPIIANTL